LRSPPPCSPAEKKLVNSGRNACKGKKRIARAPRSSEAEKSAEGLTSSTEIKLYAKKKKCRKGFYEEGKPRWHLTRKKIYRKKEQSPGKTLQGIEKKRKRKR